MNSNVIVLKREDTSATEMVSKDAGMVTSYSKDWPKAEKANSRLRLKLFTDVCLLTVAIWYFLVLFPKQDLPLLVLSIWWATSQGYLKLPRR